MREHLMGKTKTTKDDVAENLRTPEEIVPVLALGLAPQAHAGANANRGFAREVIAIGNISNVMKISDSVTSVPADDVVSGASPLKITKKVSLHSSQKHALPTQELHSYNVKFLPGGHTGWHSHPGLEIDAAPGVKGAAPTQHAPPGNTRSPTFYIVDKNGDCRKEMLAPGAARITNPGEIHLGINETGSTQYLAVVRIHPLAVPAIPVTYDSITPPTGNGCLDISTVIDPDTTSDPTCTPVSDTDSSCKDAAGFP